MSQIILKCEKFGLSRGLHDMLAAGELVDVTLACQGEFIQAHKNVLAACSPHFRSVFKLNTWQHHVVYMQDAELSKLQALVEFMYKGEVTVNDTDLPGFLKLAEALKVSGLTTLEKEQESRVSNEEKQQPVSSKNITSTPKPPPTKTARRSRDATKGVPLSEATPAPNREITCQDQGSWQQPTTEAVGQLLHPAHIKVEAEDAYDDDQSSVNLEDCILEEVDENQEDDFDGETTQGDNAAWYEAGPSTSTQINSTPSISHPSVSSRGRQLKSNTKKLEESHFLGYPSLRTLNADHGKVVSKKTTSAGPKKSENTVKSEGKNVMKKSSVSPKKSDGMKKNSCNISSTPKSDHVVKKKSSAVVLKSVASKSAVTTDKKVNVVINKPRAQPCACRTCGKVFANSINLRRHVTISHTQTTNVDIKKPCTQPCACRICGKVFANSINLKRHVTLSHTQKTNAEINKPRPQPCACRTCGKVFANGNNLRRHVTVSHPQKTIGNISCEFCDIKFYRMYSLQVHLRYTHKQESMFLCEKCPSQRFESQKLLFEHVRQNHPNQNPCPHCGNVYTQAKNLMRHMKSKHLELLKKLK